MAGPAADGWRIPDGVGGAPDLCFVALSDAEPAAASAESALSQRREDQNHDRQVDEAEGELRHGRARDRKV